MSDPAPVTLLDLDAAGMDITQPAPPEFIQFLYDNSQEGYLTIWSSMLLEQDGTTKLTQWINTGVETYRARTLQTQVAPATTKPTGDHVTEVAYSGEGSGAIEPPAAPVNVDVPLVTGPNGVDPADVGQTLNCTMGNWQGEPTGYAYQWKADDVDAGNGDTSYLVDAADAGKTITCVVTATNAIGSTVAPPSNGVVVGGGATRSRRG